MASFPSPKVFEIFNFGHFFCPKIEKGKYFLENTLKISTCEHYGLTHRKNNAKFCDANFFTFFLKTDLATF